VIERLLEPAFRHHWISPRHHSKRSSQWGVAQPNHTGGGQNPEGVDALPEHRRAGPSIGTARTTVRRPAWRPLAGGLPEPLPAIPYALLASDGRLFAGLADGQLWESRDQGDSWTRLRLDTAVGALTALADGTG